MKKTLLLLSIIIGLNTTNAQIAQQDFEGPLSSSWVGNGTIVGSQGGNWNTHGGGGMYELKYDNSIYVSLSLPAVPKSIGLWINETIFQDNSISIDLNDYSGNFIQNIGTYPASSSGYWSYKQYQLGAGYSGNYRISFSRKYTNNSVASKETYLDDIGVFNSSQIQKVSTGHFKMYPNPIQNKLNLVFKVAVVNLNIEIIDLIGRIVYSNKEKISLTANETKEIDLSSLNSGVYFCNISIGDISFVKKIIKE